MGSNYTGKAGDFRPVKRQKRISHPLAPRYASNPKPETRNPNECLKSVFDPEAQTRRETQTGRAGDNFGFWVLGILSDFGFLVSSFQSSHSLCKPPPPV